MIPLRIVQKHSVTDAHIGRTGAMLVIVHDFPGTLAL